MGPMRMGWLVLALLLGTSRAQAQLIVDYRGHLWEADTPDSVGHTSLTAVGLVQTLALPLTSDPAVYEYTWVIDGLTTDAPLSSMSSPGNVTFSGGTFSIHEDPSRNADYGVNPPNPTSPATFQDGNLYLSGNFLTLSMWWDPATQMGNLQGIIDFDGGDHLAEVNPGGSQGWTFAGTTSNPFAAIPDGYFQALDGAVFLALVAVEDATWGKVKSLYASKH